MQNEMGWLSFHGRYVHLYLNGLYWGLYDLHERPDDAFLSEYLDAEREDFDVIKHNPNDIVSGSNEFYLEMLARAREGLSTEKGLQDIQKYLDLPAFIDYMLLNFYLGNYDWAHQNYYAARNRIKQTGFRFYTWDAEHVMRYSKVDYNNTKKNDEGGPTEIHTLLKKNPEYRMMFADAVYKHCFNDGVLTPENFEKSFLFRKNEIEEAIILESARWGDYLQEESDTTYTKNEFWVPEVNKVLEEYIPQRRDIVIGQFRDVGNNLFPNYMPPVIEIDERSTEWQKIVKLVNPNSSNGNIYFTIDGTDPRRVGGAIQGTKYSEPVEIGYSTILKARFYSQADYTWSALAEKSFLFDDVFGENVVIDEIMYNPETDYPEFIELVNAGDAPVHLQGFTFSEGIEYSFKNGESIQPGAGLVLTNDTALFKSVYKFKASSQYQKRLSNGGETILLKNGLNQLVDSVTYTDTVPWPELADGDGYSLELIDTGLDNALPSSWRASSEIYGSPYNAETKLDLNVEMYPNPFNDGFNIVLDNPELANGNFTIDVFNAQGSKIKRFVLESYNSSIRINMEDIAPGLYLIRIISANNKQFKSVVLKAVKLNK
ncbi:MAG: lamin tail domain-containing protein, partial [Draconibacterium sp.]|nr:lamin tail domain-containing protein [Draconibacterium sp.]